VILAVSSRARAVAVAGLALCAALQAPSARAAGDAIDDPKLARRLGSRVSASPAPTVAPAPAVVPASAISASAQARAPEIAPASLAGAPARASNAPAAELAASPSPVDATPQPTRSASTGRTPMLGLGYRRFSFVQLGATSAGASTGAAVSEPFDSISLDFYPISRTVRFGLSTQYGWQSGSFNSGDYFIAQSASLGLQAPGPVVTPFAEAFAGAGYLRRFQFDTTVPTAYWQFGVDAGASFFLADHGYLSVALGYLRPVNGFLKQQNFTSVYVDTWSLKIGFGI
jgi:hypothetical protein